MKIGIVTLPLHTNYGGILQAYALQTILQQMGHEVILLDKQKKEHSLCKLPLVYIKLFIFKYIFRKKIFYFTIFKYCIIFFTCKFMFTTRTFHLMITRKTKEMIVI